jgi:hypothetical protein
VSVHGLLLVGLFWLYAWLVWQAVSFSVDVMMAVLGWLWQWITESDGEGLGDVLDIAGSLTDLLP